jgi:hypothetical protein
MISPITWLWNIRHRKLIEETKAMMRLHYFLRHECGLREADRLSARELRELLICLRK